MCGIFGFVTQTRFNQQRLLYSILANAMRTRGREAFGVVTADIQGTDPMVYRGTMAIDAAPNILQHVANKRIVAGHTRLGTVGKNTLDNTHPFDINGHLVAHNGIIYNWDEFPDKKKWDVDSQALAWRVATNRPTKELEGYGALWWLDPRGGLYCVRMHSGDLTLFTVKDVTGRSAHCFVSTLNAKVNSNTVETHLKGAGFTLLDYGEPEEGRVHRVTTRGFTKKERIVNVSAGTGFVDWRSGRSSSSSYGGTYTGKGGSYGSIRKVCPARDGYNGAFVGKAGDEKDTQVFLWKLYSSAKRVLEPGSQIWGRMLRENDETSVEAMVETDSVDVTGFDDGYVEAYVDDAELRHFIRNNTLTPWDLASANPDAIREIKIGERSFSIIVEDPDAFMEVWLRMVANGKPPFSFPTEAKEA